MSSVTDIAGGDAHVEDERLGLHFLGELDAAQSDDIHRHLESCPACRAKADEVIEVVAALALAAPDGEPPAEPDPAVPAGGATPPPAAGPIRPRRARSTAPDRPAAPRPGTSRPRHSSRRRRLLTSAALLVLVLVVGGLGLSAIIRGGETPGTPIVTAGATAADTRSGATASLFVTGDDDGLTVRITATGLQPGTRYVLYAVTIDGVTREVTRWTGRGDVEPVEGRLAGLRVSDLSFVTVSTAAGAVEVTVNLPPSTTRD